MGPPVNVFQKNDINGSAQGLRGGLYPAPLFHMESMWNPYGIHVVPHGICPFHMEYVLAEISPILVISFHLYSMWIPCGFHVDSTIPHGISTRNPYGMFHPISMWIPCGKIDSMWIPCGFHLESPTTNIIIIEIIVQINTKQ